PAQPIVSAVPLGQAKIVITRADQGPYIGPSALVHVAINGAPVIALGAGQSYTGGVPRGHVTLTTTLALDIAKYKYEFDAVPGKTYSFLLSRRTEHMMAPVFGGLPGLVVETALSGEQSIGRVQDHPGAVSTPVSPIPLFIMAGINAVILRCERRSRERSDSRPRPLTRSRSLSSGRPLRAGPVGSRPLPAQRGEER